MLSKSTIKGILVSILLTWLITLFLGSAGVHGTLLGIHKLHFDFASFYWSWPIFFSLAALFFAIDVLMES